jgi:CubicO group peptidase (beta-lactamase class C family)
MMTNKKMTGICIGLLFSFSLLAQTMPPTAEAIKRLQKDIPRLLEKSNVPGLSIALIRNGKMVWTQGFGIADTRNKKPVNNNTVFEAASLSKPVFAYAILKLADEGKLDLDKPLNQYLGNNYDVLNDDRINLITARHVLSHSAGFPNWRNGKDLPINFQPGSKFSYSGEGMVYLSRVAEKITGLRFEDFMQQYALQPLGMTSSSYIWRNRYDTLKAFRHDILGSWAGRNQPEDGKEDPSRDHGNAAASLSTTASDYSKFIIAILNGDGLKKATWQQMMQPQSRVNDKYPPVAWGLGIGLETMPTGEYLWHWGDNGDAKAYISALLPDKSAVVYFADGNNGLSFTKEILDDAIGGDHPALSHLKYDHFDSPNKMLARSIVSKGAEQAIKDYQETLKARADTLDEDNINELGYAFMRMNKADDAIALFTLNTRAFPHSFNAWDSLADGWKDKGDKQKAIENYEKALQINPASENTVKKLKQLKE